MRNEESIVILSDANIASLSNIEDIDVGSNTIISELIATLSFQLTGVVQV